MNKQFLKSIRDNIPESVKHIAGSFFRDKLIKNKEFCDTYNLLQKREDLPSEKIKEYQLDQLRQILVYSYENVPYYSHLFNLMSFDPYGFSEFDQIKKIPFLTRELVLKNYDSLISREKIRNGYYSGSTGGSTGLPLKFLLDYDSIYKENAFIYYFRSKLGYKFEDNLVTFRGIDLGQKLWKYNPMHNETIFSPMGLSKNTIKNYANKINDLNPQYLNGYLSAIWHFAKLLDQFKLKLKFKIKGIFLTSENIDVVQREFIEKFFDAKSITWYGHSERCVIAEETKPNIYSFDPYYGYTELIPSGNNKYIITGTGFLNYSMPFIRYKTDDLCSRVKRGYSIEGKRSSKKGLYGYNGEFISSTSFLEPFNNLTNYQFIQNVKGKADMLIVLNNDLPGRQISNIKSGIDARTRGIIDINIKSVDSLILSPRGKCQMYISNLTETSVH
jgi:phenylacetate-CoA ligase